MNILIITLNLIIARASNTGKYGYAGLFVIIVIIFCITIGIINRVDDTVKVRSRGAVDTYDYIKYFKEDRNRIYQVENRLQEKSKVKYKIKVNYTSPAGRTRKNKVIVITWNEINYVKSNPSIIMTASEYNQIVREQKQIEKNREKALKERQKAEEKAIKDAEREARRKALNEERAEIQKAKFEEKLQLMREKEAIKKALKEEQTAILNEKRQHYYDKVNEVIDYVNGYKDTDKLIIKSDKYVLDELINDLIGELNDTIKKVKNADSGEWDVLDIKISNKYCEIKKVTQRNQNILDYYNSEEFKQIKDTCGSLMKSQREFNEYIEDKAQSIATLFGQKVVRNETVNNYRQNYIRPYKKTITPFTIEVSKAVFASAENDPLEYIVKKIYTNKNNYLEQIQKLQLLIGELETLKDAKTIIDNYKKDYQQYLTNVPSYIMENDEDGFYSRLGFANISESALTIEYRFAYTSDGGMVQKSFPVPMTENTIISLIDTLEGKLTMEAFTKEQRALMTKKLRQDILDRDNHTCQECGNSTVKEPNLLLEIDHIKPVSKGGITEANNLRTLCWKCNRAKSNKII